MTRSTSQRSVKRRLGKSLNGKGLTALGSIPGAIPDVPNGEIETLKRAIAETHMLRDALSILIPDFQRLVYESERNKAVQLRLLQTVSRGPSRLIGVGTMKHSYTMDELLELEAQYVAEYDALCGLMVLIDNHQGEEDVQAA